MINGFLEQNLFELVTLEITELQISISMRCWGLASEPSDILEDWDS